MHKSPVLGALLMLTVAACGAGASYGGSSAPSTTGASSATAGVRVGTTSLGKVLVDGQGRTLYMFTADSSGRSTCDAQCLAYWPADKVAGSLPHPGAGVTAKVGSTALTTGGRTLTADGRPLYTYVQDGKPGDVTGQGIDLFGGTWYVLTPSGQPVRSTSGASTSAPRGY